MDWHGWMQGFLAFFKTHWGWFTGLSAAAIVVWLTVLEKALKIMERLGVPVRRPKLVFVGPLTFVRPDEPTMLTLQFRNRAKTKKASAFDCISLLHFERVSDKKRVRVNCGAWWEA